MTKPAQPKQLDNEQISVGLTTWAAKMDDFLFSLGDLPTISFPLSKSNAQDENCDELPVIFASEPVKGSRQKRTESRRARDRKRCSRYRERQRNERENLQTQVLFLTQELAARKKTHEDNRELYASTWKMLAQRELKALLTSEMQQRRLCEAVEVRAFHIRELQELAQNDVTTEERVGLDGMPFQRPKRVRVEPSDAAFYQAFAQDLDSIYAQTDTTLTACGLEMSEADQVVSKGKWKESGNTGFFLYVRSETIPVDFNETCQAVWQSAQLPHRQQDRQEFEGVEDPDSTAAYTFRVTNRLTTGHVVSAKERVVTRRYQTKDRMVLVWQTLLEGEGMFTGMQAGQTGWDVLTPSTDNSKPGTVVRTCVYHTPVHFGSSATADSTLQQFTDMVLEAAAEDGLEFDKEFKKLQIV